MAVLIVALATILAVNVTFRGMVDQRRSRNLFALDQGFEVALGAEGWAADILRKDAAGIADGPLGRNLGEVAVGPADRRRRRHGGRPHRGHAGPLQPEQPRVQRRHDQRNAVKQLERMLGMLEIEPTWATAMADWIDADTQPGFPDGAEDSVYTGLDPPHLAANMPITRASELMVLPEFGAERFSRLQPYIAALPVGTKLNVCTAPGIVLDSLSESQRQFSLNPEDLVKRRKEACFPTLEDLRGYARPGRLRPDQGHTFGIKHLLPSDRMGHYWHYPVHPVQSPRARWGRNGAACPAQFRSRMTV